MLGPNSWQAQRQTLETTFLSHLPETMQEVEIAYQHVRQDSWPEAAQQLIALTHKLAGTASTLGYHGIGEMARQVENFTKELVSRSPQTRPLPDELDALAEHLAVLQEAVSQRRHDASETQAQVLGSLKATPSLQENRSAQVIYLVEDDPLQAQEIAAQVSYFGYEVRIFNHLNDLGAALKTDTPAAILMDIIFPEGHMAGAEAISALGEQPPAPVIFVSIRDDLTARLQAVRAGGVAYFTKPLNVALLIDTLDRLTTQEDPLPYRVLVVDDSPVQAKMNALHLQKAGMQVEIVTDPMAIMRPLSEFHPDLILLDMYMPDCNGMELAKTIRQVDTFVSIPIVYLSAEADRDKQLEAVSLGGDDFLTKPIRPSHLVASVTARIERYRKLRSLMLRDSLTGLFNHTTTRERLAQEIGRAARQNTPLSYAMLDLDHFKNVNDTYGHSAGDRVLKSLSQVLSRRLRQSDIVGRYGGEEFAVILPNTTGQDAWHLMDELRLVFSKIRHRAGEIEFSVTFSCGIATYPEYATPAALSEAADRALYSAKNKGRNQVVL